MATKRSSRSRLRPARRSQGQEHRARRDKPSAAAARASDSARRSPKQTRESLIDICTNLRLAMAAVVVSVEALRRRNADMDEEISLVLKRGASDRMGAEVERLEALIADHRRW